MPVCKPGRVDLTLVFASGSGITDEMVQTRREQLLDVTAEDVARVAATYLQSDALSSNVIIGTESEAVNFEQNSEWTVSTIEL